VTRWDTQPIPAKSTGPQGDDRQQRRELAEPGYWLTLTAIWKRRSMKCSLPLAGASLAGLLCTTSAVLNEPSLTTFPVPRCPRIASRRCTAVRQDRAVGHRILEPRRNSESRKDPSFSFHSDKANVLTKRISRSGSMARKIVDLSERALKSQQPQGTSKLMTRVRFPSPAPSNFNDLDAVRHARFGLRSGV